MGGGDRISQVVVFGTGPFAECVRFYLSHDSDHEVVAFTVDAGHVRTHELGGLPVIAFEDVADHYPPAEHAMYVAVGYAGLNRVRAEKCEQAKARGYELITYVSSQATTWPGLEIGENCFVFEDNTIQPFVRIGNDVVMWSGNHIGHHAQIGDHCFITSHVVVSGQVKVGEYSFLGVNATLRDSIEIGDRNVIGAGALIMRSTQPREVYVPARTRPDERTSDQIGL